MAEFSMHRLVVFLLFGLVAIPVRADGWPEFRGANGQGLSAATDVPHDWDMAKDAVWKIPIPGNGWSSPVMVDGKIFLTTAVPVGEEKVSSEGKYTKKVSTPYSLHTVCVDYDTGTTIWDVEISQVPAETSIHPKNSHASATPVVASKRVFVHFGAFGTAALDFNGKVLWKKQVEFNPVHGTGGSPILFDDLLVFNCDGGDKAFVLALDADTGEEVWRAKRPDVEGMTFSFSTPLLIDVAGQRQLVSAGSHVACGYVPTTGKEIWQVRYPNKWSIVPRPVFSDGLVLICTGYEGPAELLAIRPDGMGDITETHIAWRANKFVPHNPSPIVHAGLIFLVSDNGIASCRNLKTGELRWKKRIAGDYSASPIFAEERIYFVSEDGICTVVNAATEFEQIANVEMNERTFASFAALENALIIRTEKGLYRIRK